MLISRRIFACEGGGVVPNFKGNRVGHVPWVSNHVMNAWFWPQESLNTMMLYA